MTTLTCLFCLWQSNSTALTLTSAEMSTLDQFLNWTLTFSSPVDRKILLSCPTPPLGSYSFMTSSFIHTWTHSLLSNRRSICAQEEFSRDDLSRVAVLFLYIFIYTVKYTYIFLIAVQFKQLTVFTRFDESTHSSCNRTEKTGVFAQWGKFYTVSPINIYTYNSYIHTVHLNVSSPIILYAKSIQSF